MGTTTRRLLAASIAAVGALGAAGGAQAATYTPTTTADGANGDCTAALCTLRDAVLKAGATPEEDTIVLGAGDFTLTLAGTGEDAGATGDLDVGAAGGALTIRGAGATATAVVGAFGSAPDRLLSVLGGAGLTLSDLSLTGGDARTEDGGGAILNFGTLTARRLQVDGNVARQVDASGGGNGAGGGIANLGTLVLQDSTLARNASAGDGGGLFSDGAAELTNVTIASNRTDTALADDAGYGAFGGGVEAIGGFDLTNVTVTGNTISDETGDPRGSSAGIDLSNPTTMRNVVVTGNRGLGSLAALTDCGKGLDQAADTAPNADDDGSCFKGTAALRLTDAGLGTLGLSAGETETVPVLEGSPLIDAGDGGPATDQRGIARPFGAKPDLGAVEWRPEADLAIADAVTPASAPVGSDVTHVLSITALQATTAGGAPDVVVTSALPPGATLVSATPTQGTCAGTTTVTCSLGRVATTAAPTVTLVVRGTQPGTLAVASSVSGSATELDPEDNAVTGSSAVTAPPAPPAVGGGPVAAPKPVLPRSLSARARRTRDSKLPFSWTVTGTLALPAGVPAAQGCTGEVELRVVLGRKVVARTTASLTRRCTYSATVTLRDRRKLKGRRGVLRATARFTGNAVLTARTARAVTLAYGPRRR